VLNNFGLNPAPIDFLGRYQLQAAFINVFAVILLLCAGFVVIAANVIALRAVVKKQESPHKNAPVNNTKRNMQDVLIMPHDNNVFEPVKNKK
jgi:hypothetical protein